MSGEDALREALAEVLWADDIGRDDVPLSTAGRGAQRTYARVASRLLPVVLRYGRVKAAEELLAAADYEDTNGSTMACARLHDRADALTTTDPT